jgi:hypothetical protein
MAADLPTKHRGYTPLMVAAAAGQMESVTYLLSVGADPLALDTVRGCHLSVGYSERSYPWFAYNCFCTFSQGGFRAQDMTNYDSSYCKTGRQDNISDLALLVFTFTVILSVLQFVNLDIAYRQVSA